MIPQDFLNDLKVEIAGFILEVIILFLLVPVVIWLFNRRSIRHQRFFGYLMLLRTIHSIVKEIGYLFELDKIEDKVDYGNKDFVHAYWKKYANELKISYSVNNYYGDLEACLFCVEHSISNENFDITKSAKRIKKAIKSLNLIISQLDRTLLIFAKDSKLSDSFFTLKVTSKKLVDYLTKYKNVNNQITEGEKADLLIGINLIVFTYLEEFYRRKKFVDKNAKWFVLKYEMNSSFAKIRGDSNLPVKDQLRERYLEKYKKDSEKSFAFGQLLLLIRIIRIKFRLVR